MKAEIGKQYRRRDGAITENLRSNITAILDDFILYDPHHQNTYREDGTYTVNRVEHDWDLVEEYADSATLTERMLALENEVLELKETVKILRKLI